MKNILIFIKYLNKKRYNTLYYWQLFKKNRIFKFYSNAFEKIKLNWNRFFKILILSSKEFFNYKNYSILNWMLTIIKYIDKEKIEIIDKLIILLYFILMILITLNFFIKIYPFFIFVLNKSLKFIDKIYNLNNAECMGNNQSMNCCRAKDQKSPTANLYKNSLAKNFVEKLSPKENMDEGVNENINNSLNLIKLHEKEYNNEKNEVIDKTIGPILSGIGVGTSNMIHQAKKNPRHSYKPSSPISKTKIGKAAIGGAASYTIYNEVENELRSEIYNRDIGGEEIKKNE